MSQFRKIIGASLGVALLFVPASQAFGQNTSFEIAERTPVNIHSVESGGFWTHGKDEGFFRVLVTAGGVEHVIHHLFIQWMKTDARTQGYELVRTVNVKELNLGHGHVLEVKTSFGDIDAFRIDVTAKSRGGKAKRFAITAKGDGKYVIQSR